MTLAAAETKAEIAATLSAIEANFDAPEVTVLLDQAFAAKKGVAVGVTGPPGAGKSTLINALIAEWRRQRKTVAVLAVDPSSKASGGALLGDRVRMRASSGDDGVLIRSIAARGRLGGLADIAYPAAIYLLSVFDCVVVESVGVGQSETDIATVADTVVLCIQPGSGDSLQFMKAGIVEIPNIAVVTKADMGAAATRALADLKGALSLTHLEPDAWEVECLSVSSVHDRASIRILLDALQRHAAWLATGDKSRDRRLAQASAWLASEVLAQFGLRGLAAAKTSKMLTHDGKPFQTAHRLRSTLEVIVREADR